MKTITLIIFLTIIPFLGAYSQEELTELRQQFESAVERAVSPLEEKYKDELERLKINYMRAGKLDHANAVQREIDVKFVKDKPPARIKPLNFKNIENKTYEYVTIYEEINRLTFLSDDKGNGGTLGWVAQKKNQDHWRVVGDRLEYKWSYSEDDDRTIVEFNPRNEKRTWGVADKIIFDESFNSGILINYAGQKYVFRLIEQ